MQKIGKSSLREKIKDPNRLRYLKLVFDEVLKKFNDDLVSFVIYGSVARGDDDKLSDTDVLLILNTSEPYSERCRKLATLMAQIYRRDLTIRLIEMGYNVFIEFYPLSVEEALQFRPIYLDMVDDALVLYDRNEFFKKLMASMSNLLQKLGSQKVRLGRKSWFWMLKPNVTIGEVIEYEF